MSRPPTVSAASLPICDARLLDPHHVIFLPDQQPAKPKSVLPRSEEYARVVEAMVPDDVFRRIFAGYDAGELITTYAWCRRVDLDGSWLQAPRMALAAVDEYAFSHGPRAACLARMSPDAV
jgi:hypothetical protein